MIRKLKDKTLTLLAFFMMAGCQNTAPLDLKPRKTPGDMSVTPVAQSEPNHYQVQIKWPKLIFSDRRAVDRTWILYRSQNAKPVVPLTTISPEQEEFWDKQVESGNTYAYRLGFMTGQSFVLKEAGDVLIPKDLVVSTVIQATHLTEYQRIFIRPSGVIETQGKRLDLIAEELHSEGGMIRTYEENNSAPSGINGITPEMLVLKVKRGSGTLSVRAAGQNGSTGVHGKSGVDGKAGDDGQSATTVARVGLNIPVCTSKAEDTFGKPGSPGSTGGPGGPGTNGGDSPKVYVQIDELSPLEIKVDLIAGKGGAGGKGGAAGLGGEGGKPGKSYVPCPKPQAGIRGADGAPGQDGTSGIDGSNRSYFCFKRADRIEGDCNSFVESNGIVL